MGKGKDEAKYKQICTERAVMKMREQNQLPQVIATAADLTGTKKRSKEEMAVVHAAKETRKKARLEKLEAKKGQGKEEKKQDEAADDDDSDPEWEEVDEQ